ncbi:MAG: hypothetical protein SFU56_22050 [Capsulimonadales bacterium]|nr:hypothetical protein [Capsulimonadales bacterium]
MKPRNKYDWRWILVLYPITLAIVIPLGFLWLSPALLVAAMGAPAMVAFLVGLLQWLVWMAVSCAAIVNYLEVDDEGFVAPTLFQKTRVAWTDVESVSVVTRGEYLRATLRWPFRDRTLRFSNSPFTFSEYIRIRHKGGTVYFSAEDTQEALTEILTLRRDGQAATRWYHAATTTASAPDPVRIVGRSIG